MSDDLNKQLVAVHSLVKSQAETISILKTENEQLRSLRRKPHAEVCRKFVLSKQSIAGCVVATDSGSGKKSKTLRVFIKKVLNCLPNFSTPLSLIVSFADFEPQHIVLSSPLSVDQLIDFPDYANSVSNFEIALVDSSRVPLGTATIDIASLVPLEGAWVDSQVRIRSTIQVDCKFTLV